MHDLILLHGAIGSSEQLKPLELKLSANFIVHNLDLPGHGGQEMPPEFNIKFFTSWVSRYCEQRNLKKISVFGYSMGGYVGMYMARQYPSLVNRLATLATKFHWDEAIAAREIKMLQPEIIRQKLPDFATTLERRHAPLPWENVLSKTADLLTGLGKNNILKPQDYSLINHPCLLMLGDRDKMVSLEETVSVYKMLPAGMLAILPGTPHPVEAANVESLSFMLTQFML